MFISFVQKFGKTQMMQFDWSKFTTIHGKPVTLVTNGYVQEPEGLRCNRTNGKSGYKRLRIAGGVTIIEEPVTNRLHVKAAILRM